LSSRRDSSELQGWLLHCAAKNVYLVDISVPLAIKPQPYFYVGWLAGFVCILMELYMTSRLCPDFRSCCFHQSSRASLP
jgi:hypothetical protein